MSKEPSERRTYRRSPGRQYGYEQDPPNTEDLRSRRSEPLDSSLLDKYASKSGSREEKSTTALTQRPDIRRTRQLLRKNIIASKTTQLNEENSLASEPDTEDIGQSDYYASDHDVFDEHTPARRVYPRGSAERSPLPATRDLMPSDERWDDDSEYGSEFDYDDADEETIDAEEGVVAYEAPAPAPQMRYVPRRSQRLQAEPAYEADYDDDTIDEKPAARPRKRKQKLSRRKLLLGAGAVAVGGATVAAVELAPKLPQAVGNVGSNIEHQLQDAFNRGIAQGADAARKEFITALENLEGVTLDGAIDAARLTRVAYDVFVSPLVKFGATVTGDFLQGMLQAVKTARGWLAGAFQDNATLQAIQKVLQSWVDQTNTMPKKLDSITQSDLDGAQAYLRALKRKVAEEQAKLNKPQTPSSQK